MHLHSVAIHTCLYRRWEPYDAWGPLDDKRSCRILGLCRNRGSSVSIVSDYGLDDRAIGVRSPAGVKDFSSNLCVQTGSEAHPASGVLSPGLKRGRGVTLTTPPHLVPRSRMSRSYTSTPPPPSASMACNGTALLQAYAGFKKYFIPSVTPKIFNT
jgi:hypothetical protein